MGKLQNIKKIREDGSWQSAAWLLERQYPGEFGRREKVNIDGSLNVNEKVSIKDFEKSMDSIDD